MCLGSERWGTIVQSKGGNHSEPRYCRGDIISSILEALFYPFYPLRTFNCRKQRAGTIHPHKDKARACHILLAQPSGLSGSPTWVVAHQGCAMTRFACSEIAETLKSHFLTIFVAEKTDGHHDVAMFYRLKWQGRVR